MVEEILTGILFDGDVTLEGVDTVVAEAGALVAAATPLGEFELTFP